MALAHFWRQTSVFLTFSNLDAWTREVLGPGGGRHDVYPRLESWARMQMYAVDVRVDETRGAKKDSAHKTFFDIV